MTQKLYKNRNSGQRTVDKGWTYHTAEFHGYVRWPSAEPSEIRKRQQFRSKKSSNNAVGKHTFVEPGMKAIRVHT